MSRSVRLRTTLVRLSRRLRLRCPGCGFYRCGSNPALPESEKDHLRRTYGADITCRPR